MRLLVVLRVLRLGCLGYLLMAAETAAGVDLVLFGLLADLLEVDFFELRSG